MAVLVLGPLRHACFRCGGGCHGTDVRVLDDEREALTERAAALGIDVPFDGEFLAKDGAGTCVFLEGEATCRLHAAYGLEGKPRVCAQYPLVATASGEDARIAVDPGCLHAWRSFREGPEVEVDDPLPTNGKQPPWWDVEEQVVLAVCDPELRGVAGVLAVFIGIAEASSLPIGITRRLAQRVLDSGLGPRLVHPDNSRTIREQLAPVSAFLETLDTAKLPPWQVSSEMDLWAVEAARRFAFIRVAQTSRPLTRALAMLAGALVCGWTDPDPERFGPALAAWSRVMRTPAMLDLFPDDQTVRRVLGRNA